MNHVDVLRFGWKPNELRVLLVALADPGPVTVGTWVKRTQVPRSDHFGTALKELERLGAVKWEARQEGLCVWVQPVEFWRAKPLMDLGPWREAWQSGQGNGQRRLALPTEDKSVAEAMAITPDFRESSRFPGVVGVPAAAVLPRLPISGSPRVEVLEKEAEISRVSRDRGAETLPTVDRAYLLSKLKRIPRLEAEVLRPQNEQQQRISRLFWEMASEQPSFLAGALVDLADSTTTVNKAAWFNRVATEWSKLRKAAAEVKA